MDNQVLGVDSYRETMKDKTLQEIFLEKKKVENKISIIERNKDIKNNNINLQTNENHNNDTSLAIDKSNLGNTSDEILNLYMGYNAVLTELIKSKSIYWDEKAYIEGLKGKTKEELLNIQASLKLDIETYYKNINKMKQIDVLMRVPIVNKFIKNKNINDNNDILEIIMKKERYVEVIAEMLKHLE